MNLTKSRLLSFATSLLVIGSSFVGIGATAANAASTPITVNFESNDTSGYALGVPDAVDFGGNVSSLVTSTVGSNTSKVAKIVNGPECWSGTTFLKVADGTKLITEANQKVTADVYSTIPVSNVKMKLEGGAGQPAREIDVAHTGSGWESLTWDMALIGTGFAPGKYSIASIFVGFQCGTSSAKPAEAFFDNVVFAGATTETVVVTPPSNDRTAPATLINFESNDTSGYALTNDFGGSVSSVVTDAPAMGSVGSTKALKIISQGECWAGSTFINKAGKQSLVSTSTGKTITANIYSPVSGASIMLKLESTTAIGAVEEITVTSVAGWKKYTFQSVNTDNGVDYNSANFHMNFTCVSGTKSADPWYVDDIAFNGAVGAALDTVVVPPTVFTGNATLRLVGMNDTNSFDRPADATLFSVTNPWYHTGIRTRTKQVPVGSTQQLTYLVTNSDTGAALANTTVTLVVGKEYSGSNAKVSSGSAVSTGAQATVTGVTNSNGQVTFSLANTDVAIDAADNPGANLGSNYSGKHLFTQTAAWVTDQAKDTIDLVDLVYFKPADAPVVTTSVIRLNGLDSTNSVNISDPGWFSYYGEGVRYFEKGVEVGSTNSFTATVTDTNGALLKNKTVHLLLNKEYSGSTASITVNGVTATGGQQTIDLVTNSSGQVSFTVVNNNVAADAAPYQAGNLQHAATGTHLFSQITVVGDKGNADVIDVLDLNFYKPAGGPAAVTYATRLADWTAANSFDGTHIWGDGGLGSWFDVNTRYFAHYVKVGSTFNLRYKVTNETTGANAPDGTSVTLALGAAWSGSNAKFTVGSVVVDGKTKWGANGQLDQGNVTGTTVGGYVTFSLKSNDLDEDGTENPGSPTANSVGLNPLYMQVKANVDGNTVNHGDWVNIVATKGAAQAPVVTSVSATTGKKGQAIDIVGTHLGDALGLSVVLFTPATTKLSAVTTPVTVLSVSADGTRLTVSSPSLTQKGSFKVTTSAGTGSATALFSASSTATSKPTITLAASLVKEIGSTITLAGTNLGSATAVTIGGVSAPFSILTANSLLVTVPAGVASGSTISVTNLGGTVTTSKFVYQAAVVASRTASARVGQTVTISGSNLKVTSVVFGGNKSAKPVINNGSTLTVVVPTGALTGAIKITTGAGVVYTESFTVTPPAPTVTSFTPVTGKKGVTVVTVKGTNLTGATATVGSTVVVISAGANSTSFKFVIPAGATTGKINVTTGGGTVSSAANLTVN